MPISNPVTLSTGSGNPPMHNPGPSTAGSADPTIPNPGPSTAGSADPTIPNPVTPSTGSGNPPPRKRSKGKERQTHSTQIESTDITVTETEEGSQGTQAESSTMASRKRRISALETTEETLMSSFQPTTPVTERRLAPELREKEVFSTIKLKLSTSLQITCKGYRDVFRQVAEEFSIRRRDAMNLALLMVARWVGSSYHPSVYPDITTNVFWSHAYRIVSNGLDLYNRNIDFSEKMAYCMNLFEAFKKNQNDEYYYNVPPMDTLHGALATAFTTDMVQNVGVFLSRHVRSIMKKFFRGFFLDYRYQKLVDCDPFVLMSTALDCIINSKDENEFSALLPVDENRQIAITEYRFVVRLFQQLTTDSGCNLEQLEDYDTALTQSHHILRFSAGLLDHVERSGIERIKRWNMLPQPQHGIVHFPLSGPITMYNFLRRVFVSTPRAEMLANLPDSVLNESREDMITLAQFQRLYADEAMRTRLWREIFNFRKIGAHTNAQFFNGLKTDGHMASFLFQKTITYRLSTDREEMDKEPQRVNLKNVTKGIYSLNKKPIGIPNHNVFGIDPGVRDVVVGVGPQQADSIRFSNAQYKVRSGMLWSQQQELKKRQHANIQEVYDRLTSSKSANIYVILAYIRTLSQEHNQIFDFMKTYNHREAKGYNYSNRNAALSHLSNVVAGFALPNEPFNLCHKTKSKSRQRKRSKFRDSKDFQRRQEKTIVAYGNASIMGTMRKHTPVPVKKSLRAIAERSVVILVDEFRTSVTCSSCHGRLDNKYHRQVLVCNHKKKKTRQRRPDTIREKNTTSKCLSETGEIICRTSECTDRVAKRHPKNTLIYPLKVCSTCLDGRKVWNRDINAALNIRGVLLDYIRSNYNINSRHESLRRP